MISLRSLTAATGGSGSRVELSKTLGIGKTLFYFKTLETTPTLLIKKGISSSSQSTSIRSSRVGVQSSRAREGLNCERYEFHRSYSALNRYNTHVTPTLTSATTILNEVGLGGYGKGLREGSFGRLVYSVESSHNGSGGRRYYSTFQSPRVAPPVKKQRGMIGHFVFLMIKWGFPILLIVLCVMQLVEKQFCPNHYPWLKFLEIEEQYMLGPGCSKKVYCSGTETMQHVGVLTSSNFLVVLKSQKNKEKDGAEEGKSDASVVEDGQPDNFYQINPTELSLAEYEAYLAEHHPTSRFVVAKNTINLIENKKNDPAYVSIIHAVAQQILDHPNQRMLHRICASDISFDIFVCPECRGTSLIRKHDLDRYHTQGRNLVSLDNKPVIIVKNQPNSVVANLLNPGRSPNTPVGFEVQTWERKSRQK